MGANAQTTVPTFTAAQVLTADQMNQSARTGVPVFANSTARDAAFGGSGEKTLAEGQLCYLESTNVVQYYDGAAWATVGPQTLTSGLNYITGATFTTATSVSLPDNTFSSTYQNYRVIYSITAATGTGTITGRYRASGSDNTTARYFQMSNGLDINGTASNQAQSGATSFALGSQGSAAIPAWHLIVDFIQPNVSNKWKAVVGSLQFFDGTSLYIGRPFNGVLDTTGSAFQVDSFSVISSAASSITGNYRVYGYSDS
jgi:hypothetical protein